MTAILEKRKVPREFVFRRLHSLMGFWFVLFLCEHMFTNSQAALFFADDGTWFVRSVNFLRNLPYLQIIEVVFLGIPFLYHAAWGVYYMTTSKSNALPGGGKKPSIRTARNVAYSWQRITAWILLVGTVLHVVQMRFIDYPYKYKHDGAAHYYAKYNIDPALYGVADRLGIALYDQKDIQREKNKYDNAGHKINIVLNRMKELKKEIREKGESEVYSGELNSIYKTLGTYESARQHIRGLESRSIGPDQVMGVTTDFGAAVLLSVREVFQSLIMCLLYSAFVLSAVFHAFNGLWTFCISWGLLISSNAQKTGTLFCHGILVFFGFLGFMAIWGTYFLNLKG